MKALRILLQAIVNLTKPIRSAGFVLVFCCFGVVACGGGGGGDPGDEGGLIGTGIIGEEGGVIGTGFAGTVSETKVLASESVEIKSSTGEKSTAALNRNRRYSASSLSGEAPYLVRSNLGGGEYRYAIAYRAGAVSNINSYSDAILQLWFQDLGQNINNAFANNQPLSNLPSLQQFNQISDNLFAAVELVLESYGFSKEQILSASFDADDRGIDEYLDKNPVVINGSQINIVVTDPVTQYQSSTSTVSTAVGSVSSNDTQSPNVVENVRAFASGLTEIVVVWDAATDNVGVVGYQVYRDGALLATTPFPVYTDASVAQGTFPAYQIAAFDSSNLFSLLSDPANGRPLVAVDNELPPIPIDVELEDGPVGQVTLKWTITTIGDVVAFNVYRSAAGEASRPLLTSTSTRFTDVSVSTGVRYCYRIESVDVAGNTSGLTDEFCVDASAATNGTSGSGAETVGDLLIPTDLDDINCNATFPAAITEDATFSEPCYLVNSDVEILQFADVEITAGTVLKFAQNTGIEVTTGTSLSVVGEIDNPVIFTGQEEVRGYWRGITYDRTESRNNQVINAVIEYAGRGQGASISLVSRENARARLRVEGSVMRYSAGLGVWFNDRSSRLDAFAGNVLTENRQPAHINPVLLPMISTNNRMTGNEIDQVTVGRLSIDDDLIIPNLGVPLRNFGLTVVGADLTIDAGVEIIFGPGVVVSIEGGDLIVNGTTDNPVLLTSSVMDPGGWGGVHLIDSTDSKLEGLTISYGGESLARYNANLSLENSTASLRNVTLRDSSGYGYYRDENSDLINLGGVQQIDNAQQQ